MPLNHVQIPWAWLEEHLNRVIDEVNQNKPISSSSIAVDVSTTGSLLRTTEQTDKQKQQGQQGPPPDFAKITSINWYGVKWQTVAVIDQTSCVVSTIQVLTKGSSGDFVSIGLSPPLAGFPS